MDYTLEDFEKELKNLLNKAVNAGHSVDQIGELAEYIISDSAWGIESEEQKIN